MYRKIKSSQSSWLVPAGIVCILIGLSVILISEAESLLPARNISIALPWLFIFSVFLAPVIEEVSFRGFFTSRRWLRIVAFIFLTAYVVLGSNSWLSYSTYAVFILFTLLDLTKQSPGYLYPKFLSNAFLFGIIHWEITDFTVLIASLVHIGIGLILIWIVLNFGIIRAMLFHGAYNLLLMVILLFTLQFPDDEKHQKETENYILEWNRVPLISEAEGTFEFFDNGMNSRSLSAKKTYAVLTAANQGIDLRDVTVLEPYMKYNIKLTFKDSVPNSTIFQVLISELDTAGIWTCSEETTRKDAMN